MVFSCARSGCWRDTIERLKRERGGEVFVSRAVAVRAGADGGLVAVNLAHQGSRRRDNAIRLDTP